MRVEIVIAPDGTVKRTRVLGGHPVLAVEAEHAAQKSTFEPGLKEDHRNNRLQILTEQRRYGIWPPTDGGTIRISPRTINRLVFRSCPCRLIRIAHKNIAQSRRIFKAEYRLF